MTGWSRRVRSPWAVGLMLVAVVSLLGWLVFFSPVFSARNIVVVGFDQVTEQQVVDAAAVPSRMALARLPLSDIATRVEGLDAVAAARVEREWPDTVRIVVTERRPVAALKTDDGYGIVGSDGAMYRVVTTRPTDLPLLEGSLPDPGSEADVTLSDASFTVARDLPHRFAVKVDRIDATSADELQITLRTGEVVQWGSANSTRVKAQVTAQLLRKDAARYDVSVPDAPAWSG